MSKPALSICRTPFTRNASKYQEFLTKSFQNSHKNEEEFNALVDEAFFNQPEDFIIGLNVAPSYAEVVQKLFFTFDKCCFFIEFECRCCFLQSEKRTDIYANSS